MTRTLRSLITNCFPICLYFILIAQFSQDGLIVRYSILTVHTWQSEKLCTENRYLQ